MEEMKLFFEDLRNQQSVYGIFKEIENDFNELIKEGEQLIDRYKEQQG